MYKHSLKLSAQTTGGRKQLNAEVRLTGACDAKFKYCKANVEVDRTAMYSDEDSDWKLTSKIQVLTPDSVNNAQQLAELEQKNQKFVLQSECEWGSHQKQSVNLRIQGMQAQTQQQRQQIQSYQGPQQHYQKKRAAFLNKFDVVADYKLKPTMQNIANRLFEVVKTYDLWNTQSQLEGTGQDGQMHATMVIDPIGQQLANISIKTATQAVRIQSVRLPYQIRPFALVRKNNKASHSAQQFVTRITSDKGRAECTVDGKRVDTFDGVLYKAPIGKCYSVLAKDCSDDNPRFVVLMKALNEDRQDKKIKVITPEQTIECQSTKSSSRGKKLQCKINGQVVNAKANGDYEDDSNSQDNVNENSNGQRLVEYNDDQTEVTINVEGVSVRFGCWCNSCKCQKAWIKIGNQYKEGQCGLCGHYDDQADNDLRMGNNEQTDDLRQFHRSFSLKDDQCTEDDQEDFYGQQNEKKFGRVDVDRRSMKRANQDEDENDFDNNDDIEWQAGGYDSNEDGDQWSQAMSKPWKKHQQKHQQKS
jgi:hypothetical protein